LNREAANSCRNAKALPGNRHRGRRTSHRLRPSSAANKDCGHDTTDLRSIIISGPQRLRHHEARDSRRRFSIEAVIDHMKINGHLPAAI
jgi:hypothetical protein